jgi:hypothetical protein
MSSNKIILQKLKKSEENAKKNLIKAQEKSRIAYQMVMKAQQKYKLQVEKVEKLKKKINDQKKKSTKSTKTKSTKKNTKKSTKKRSMRGGGGSDWLNTVNSRGNVAGPNDHWGVPGEKWSSQFEKSGEYIPMSELRKGSFELQKQKLNQIPTGLFKDSLNYESVSSAVDLLTQKGV